MTIIRVLLILGLVYVALQQKKESTRNVILFVTGILAFCMMGKEGFALVTVLHQDGSGGSGTRTFGGWPSPEDVNLSEVSIVNNEGDTKFYFEFHHATVEGGDINIGPPASVPLPTGSATPADRVNDVIRCKSGNLSDNIYYGVVGYNGAQTDWSDGHLDSLSQPNITDYLTCTVPCSSTADPDQCGAGMTYDTSKATSSFSGSVGTADYISTCCMVDPASSLCSATPAAVADTQCGAGMKYDTSKATSSFSGSADYISTCCTTDTSSGGGTTPTTCCSNSLNDAYDDEATPGKYNSAPQLCCNLDVKDGNYWWSNKCSTGAQLASCPPPWYSI
jgi:hypothetical protein